MKTPTINEFKAWALEHQSLALAVCKAQAFAQCERIRVDKYVKPIFDRYEFHSTLCGSTGRITDPERLYLCEDEPLCAAYYAACDKAHREHGFKGEPGQCPALVADTRRIQLENGLLRAGCELFDLQDIPSLPDQRAQMLRLLLGACLIKERKAA